LRQRLPLLASLAVFAVFAACLGSIAAYTLSVLLRAGAPGWLAEQSEEVVRVIYVRAGGPAEGRLRRGDEVLARDGRGVRTVLDVAHWYQREPPGTRYRLAVRRDGRVLDLTLETARFGLSWATVLRLAPILVGGLFLAFGLAILLLRPFDAQTRRLALVFCLFVQGDPLFVDPAGLAAWQRAAFVVAGSLAIFAWPLFLHFFLLFPEPSPLARRFPRLVRWLYLPPAGLFPVFALYLLMLFVDPAVAFAFRRGIEPLNASGLVLMAGYASLGLLSLVLNYRRATAAGRRRLRVVLVGTMAGFVPLALVYLAGVAVDVSRLPVGVILGAWAVVLVALALVPLSFAYAIVRHQVIPIRIMLRRGMRYLLVAHGFFLIEALALAAAVAYILTGDRGAFLDRLGERADIGATALVAGLVLGALTLVHRRVMPVIDRRFFRDAYDAQAIQAEIGEAARRTGGVEQLLALAAARVHEALHPEGLSVFLRDEESGTYACIFPPEEGAMRLSDEAPVVAALRRKPRLLETESGGLNLPIVAKGDLFGILSIGPRLGDLPYSREDRALLQAVAWQLAFAIENARLVRRMVEEERLRREIAVASEVQQRLFPERPPESRLLDLAGLCYPAQGVGGDYFDFLRLDARRLAVAVADVAGKGISAALLMSVVQASLRSQAGSVPPPELVEAMNRLLYRSAARNRFATFFYGEFDEASGRLVYVNAGHNPPLLFRNAGAAPLGLPARRAAVGGAESAVAVSAPDASLLRLSTGGLVIGAVAATRYEQAEVVLAPGDVLVAYTDGVTEAWNAGEEEFGEQRLADVVASCSHQPAAAIADAVVRAVREFADPIPPHDDVTLVVAKVR
jgi:sigma-B regulation protein RsbU (phosphoserine phosphatase)